MRTPILSLLIAILCIACDGKNNQIKEVAYEYCFTTANYDIDGAEKYCTEETSLKTLKATRYLLQFVDSAYIASDTPATIDITKVKQTSDTTAFAIYHKVTPIKDFSDTVQLRLRDGRWLVHDI
ncbi:MAG: hypothetical protein ACSW8I_00410 [bacterium]